MISDHISDIITAAKAMPNSESKNRGLSHLKDALAHFTVLEIEQGLTQRVDEFAGANQCTCSIGVRDNDCPIHGAKAA